MGKNSRTPEMATPFVGVYNRAGLFGHCFRYHCDSMHSTIGRGEFTRRLFLLTLVVISAAAGLGLLLVGMLDRPAPDRRVTLPAALYVSTLLLVAGSGLLQFGHGKVRQEKQIPFRRALVAALIVGTLYSSEFSPTESGVFFIDNRPL